MIFRRIFDVPGGSFWISHFALYPQLKNLTASFITDTVEISAKSSIRDDFVLDQSYLNRANPQTLLLNVQDSQVRFKISDKIFSPVLHSCNLHLKQRHLLLYDGKGTCMYTAKPKDFICKLLCIDWNILCKTVLVKNQLLSITATFKKFGRLLLE